MSGHDKRTCLYRELEEEQEIPKIETKKAKHVFVKVEPRHIPSQHRVDLKEEKENRLDYMPVYREQNFARPTLETVDLAAMVRSANQRLAINDQRTTSLEKKRKLPSFFVGLPKVPKPKLKPQAEPIKVCSSFKTVKELAGFRRAAYAAVCALLIFAAPFPAATYYNKLKDSSQKVIEESTNAFLSLQSSTVAAFASNIEGATYDLNAALKSFGNAKTIVEQEHGALVYVASMLPVIGKQVSSRTHLLSAGQHLALGNTYILKGISKVEENTSIHFTDKLKILKNHFKGAIPQYSEALKDLSAVDNSSIPAQYQQSFDDFKLLFTALIDDMNNMTDLIGALETVFGADDFKRYLIIFQNNHELRPTGGFMGSFAIVDMQKGRLLNIEVPGGGTYDIKGQLDQYVEPPLPLQLMNGRWEFQDANWFPDFSASAEKMAWFYRHSRSATVDGVIAINASVLERILNVLGPLENEQFGLLLSSEDALRQLQEEVELDYDREENKPKAVLGSVLEQLLEELPHLENLQVVGLITQLYEALEQREIQIFMKDEDVQKQLREYGWTGEIVSTPVGQDYLQVVFANVHGQKSDAKIQQEIEHQAVVQDDGSVVDTVIIRRTHSGTPGETFYGVNNIGYIRAYVPEGSVLLDAGGFTYPPEEEFKVPQEWYKKDSDLQNKEIEEGVHIKTGTRVTREFGKTAFGNWMIVPPGETREVYFTYKLPFRLFQNNTVEKQNVADGIKSLILSKSKKGSRYSLIHQKQSGVNSKFTSQIIYPSEWEARWKTGESVSLVQNGAILQTDMEKDVVFGVVMEE